MKSQLCLACQVKKVVSVSCRVRWIFLLAEQPTELQWNITIWSVTLKFVQDSSRCIRGVSCFLSSHKYYCKQITSHIITFQFRDNLKALGCLKRYCNTREAWPYIKITTCVFQFSNKMSIKIPNDFTSFIYLVAGCHQQFVFGKCFWDRQTGLFNAE